ncbi:OmpH family outer membrane protein [Roseivirga sp.]|uniref:OmpH family outer membrane protein n=1 Tax=Roseivirga sp. TaxID=1964215 RepID=UPI003B8D8579
MKRRLLVMVAALFVFGATQAQDFKIGFTYLEFIVYSMPEIEGIRSELKTYEGQLGSNVQAKRTTFQTKYEEAQRMSQQPNASQAAMQELNNELQKLDKDLQDYTAQAQQALQAKEATLMNPIYSKVQTAIDEVRKELGYAMILNMRVSASGDGIVLAAEDDLNITEQVFAKLGVEMPKQPSPGDAPATADTGNDK